MKKAVLFFLIFFTSFKIVFAEKNLIINQIMTGQEDSAKNEFIELYNPNNYEIDLKGYSLKKKSSTGNESSLISEKYFIGKIKAKSYFLISSPEFCSKIRCDLSYSSSNSISKNNSILLYKNKELVDKLGYGTSIDFLKEAAENPENNYSLKKIDINSDNSNNKIDFQIKKNDIVIKNSKNELIRINNFLEEASLEEKNNSKNNDKIKFINLKNIKEVKNKETVITEGIVTCLPKDLASQYFYIHEKSNDDNIIYGIQIYNYNKKFKELKIGDRIKVVGEVSITEDTPNYNYKIKTKNFEDIEIIKSNEKIEEIGIEKINNLKIEHSGYLKKIKGEISQNKSKQIYLDDGSGEILIEIKSGTKINSKSLKEGQKFEITGVLAYKQKEAKIIVLKNEDIKNLNEQIEESIGKTLDDDFWELQDKKNKNEFFKYLILIIIIAILYIFFNKKIKNRL